MTPFISLGIKLQRFVYTLSIYRGNLMIVEKIHIFIKSCSRPIIGFSLAIPIIWASV